MTTSRVRRLTVGGLDGTFCADAGRRVVLTFIPGDGNGIADLLELRPLRTKRAERIAVIDVYRYALRCRVNRDVLECARQKKARKAERLASQRLDRATKRLFEKVSH